jgi:hypothetical protein
MSLLFGAVFRDPASISFGERALEGSGFKVLAVSRRSGLLPPGFVQFTTVHWVETEIVNEAKHCGFGLRRITGDRESDPRLRSPRNAFLKEALCVDVVERLDHGTPDLLRDPLTLGHSVIDLGDASIAKLGMVVTDINYDDAVRHVRKQPLRKFSNGLRWDCEHDDFSTLDGLGNGNGPHADLGRQRGQALWSSRVRNRDVMTELPEVTRKYASHASSADDSDSHVE